MKRLDKWTVILIIGGLVIAGLIIGNKLQGHEQGFDSDTSWGELWIPAFFLVGAGVNEWIRRKQSPVTNPAVAKGEWKCTSCAAVGRETWNSVDRLDCRVCGNGRLYDQAETR